MRRVSIAAVSLVVMAVTVFLARDKQEKPAGPRRHWVKIVFGIDGKEDSWDGRVEMKDGKVHDLAEWAFEDRDKVEARMLSWTITTGVLPQNRVTQAEPMRGVLVEVE